MRIDASQILSQGGIRIKPGTGSFADSLREGDTIRAQVLSSENGVTEMKTESGQVFKTKLESSLALLPGDEVELEVGKDKSMTLVSVSREETDINEISGRESRYNAPANNSLEPFLSKLTSLNMPATREAAQLMKNLLAQNPGLTLEEAAFLASNKLTGNESLMKAALALLSGAEKTDAMIERLIMLLNQTQAGASETEHGQNPKTGQQISSNAQNSQNVIQTILQKPPTDIAQPQGKQADFAYTSMTASASNTAPLTDLLTMIMRGGTGTQETPTTIISQSDSVLQSLIIEKTEENVKDGIKPNLQKPETGAETAKTSSSITSTNTLAQDAIAQIKNMGTMPEATVQIQGAAHTVPETPAVSNPAVSTTDAAAVTAGATATVGAAATETAEMPQNIQQAAQQNPSLEALHSRLSDVLSEIPEFRGTPAEALERFSSMLLRVAGESMQGLGGDPKKLEALLNKLFTEVDGSDNELGAKLKGAREELFARLSLIEESMTRAAPSARADMVDQVQRLMEHVRVLNSIETFAYMQLPVKFGEERKTADLYIFKKKGGKKPDPENVNILLALDLEHMGHWESLINIKKQDVSLQMEVAGAKEKEHFSENTVLLHEMLAQAGFKLVNTDITYNEEETTPLTALSSLGRYTSAKSGRIDFML